MRPIYVVMQTRSEYSDLETTAHVAFTSRKKAEKRAIESEARFEEIMQQYRAARDKACYGRDGDRVRGDARTEADALIKASGLGDDMSVWDAPVTFDVEEVKLEEDDE